MSISYSSRLGEDFVDEKLAVVEDYLQLKLSGSSDVGADFNRVVRTKSYGDWLNWFLPEEIGRFRNLFLRYMNMFGYADEWKLSIAPYIPSENASGYVKKIVMERH